MLKIRPEQLGAMQEARLEAAIRQHLGGHHAAAIAALSTDECTQLVRDGIAHARGYGMSSPSSIGAFVAIMAEIGPGFDRTPALRQALSDPSVAPDERIKLLAERITAVIAQPGEPTGRAPWMP